MWCGVWCVVCGVVLLMLCVVCVVWCDGVVATARVAAAAMVLMRVAAAAAPCPEAHPGRGRTPEEGAAGRPGSAVGVPCAFVRRNTNAEARAHELTPDLRKRQRQIQLIVSITATCGSRAGVCASKSATHLPICSTWFKRSQEGGNVSAKVVACLQARAHTDHGVRI